MLILSILCQHIVLFTQGLTPYPSLYPQVNPAAQWVDEVSPLPRN